MYVLENQWKGHQSLKQGRARNSSGLESEAAACFVSAEKRQSNVTFLSVGSRESRFRSANDQQGCSCTVVDMPLG